MQQAKCAVCQGEIEGVAHCPRCMASIHLECKPFVDKCVSYGCSGKEGGLEKAVASGSEGCSNGGGVLSSEEISARDQAIKRAESYLLEKNEWTWTERLNWSGVNTNLQIDPISALCYYAQGENYKTAASEVFGANSGDTIFWNLLGNSILKKDNLSAARGLALARKIGNRFCDAPYDNATFSKTCENFPDPVTFYTFVVQDLLVARKDSDALKIAAESGDSKLLSQTSFTVGRRLYSDNKWNEAIDVLLDGGHEEKAEEILFRMKEPGGAQIIRVYNLRESKLGEPVVVERAKLLLEFAMRLRGANCGMLDKEMPIRPDTKPLSGLCRPNSDWFSTMAEEAYGKALRYLEFEHDAAGIKDLTYTFFLAANQFKSPLKSSVGRFEHHFIEKGKGVIPEHPKPLPYPYNPSD